MGRTLLVSRTSSYGDMWIPDEHVLGVQLCQVIIGHVFSKQTYRDFECPFFKPDLRAEVYELFVMHEGVNRIPHEHLDQLVDMGVGYLLNFRDTLQMLQEQYCSEPLLIETQSLRSDRVAIVV